MHKPNVGIVMPFFRLRSLLGTGVSRDPNEILGCKRSVVIDGHKSSVSLEDSFWTELKKIAHTRQVTLSEVIGKIEATHAQSNLSSAIRLFVLQHFRGDKRMDAAKPHLSAMAAERTPAS